jgi:outer membrane protein assembly factor BamB
MAIEFRDARGRLLWTDERKGAYLRPPAADVVDGAPVILSDDHGELRRYGANGSVAWMSDWTAAYTMPIPGPFGPDGSWAVLRAGGIHGLELLDAGGATIWRTDTDLWEYASSVPAIGRVGAHAATSSLGVVTRSGVFACVDVRTGKTRWELDLGCPPNASSVVAADLDGDGTDEFVVGLPDGRLVCLGEDGRGSGEIRWTLPFDAAVSNSIVVDLDGDGLAQLVVATADGQVRWLA